MEPPLRFWLPFMGSMACLSWQSSRPLLVSTPPEYLTPLAGRKLDTSHTGIGSRPTLPLSETGGGRGVQRAGLGRGPQALPSGAPEQDGHRQATRDEPSDRDQTAGAS